MLFYVKRDLGLIFQVIDSVVFHVRRVPGICMKAKCRAADAGCMEKFKHDWKDKSVVPYLNQIFRKHWISPLLIKQGKLSPIQTTELEQETEQD